MHRRLSVRALDQFLNQQLVRSPRTAEWWRVKIRAKRLLALAAPQDVDRLARRMLAVLRTKRRDRDRLAA